MQKRDVIIDAIRHKNPAHTPWNIELTAQFRDKTAAQCGCADPELFFQNHMLRKKYKKNRKLENGQEVDLFGVTWEHAKDGGDVGNVVDYPLLRMDLADYRFPEVDVPFATELANQLVREKQETGRFTMFSITMGYFERLWSLYSMEEALVNMIADEETTFAVLEQIEAHHHKLLDTVLDYDFDAIYFGDDWGQQHELMMGPALWRKFLKPGMARLFAHAKRKGKFVVLHSCGDLRSILGDLVDMGLDVYNTVQPEIYDLQTLKREYGADLTFYGGISTQQFLPGATAAQCKDMARRMIDQMAAGGGYILSLTHAVTPDIPVENILALVEAANEYG